ncbi:heavy metal-associated isoprenylated plant protein 43-like [Silene latifolia]|uniref:heavy metal-associated isoprenylated plant protein 43-like n=1 Tax=Silene latifolia TaxID=37657 RepID=UPI003D77EA56
MGKKRTQLKIIDSGRRNRNEILTAVAKLEGVDKLEMDASKGVLTVVGEVEPVPIFMALKKICVKSEILTVGPPKPERPGEKSGDQQQVWRSGPANPCQCSYNYYCKQCELIAVGHPFSADTGQCSIL